MKANIPTLSKQGYITDPHQAILYLFKAFCTSDKSQSNFWRGQVASLVYLIKKNTKTMDSLRGDVEEALQQLYNTYFEDVRVQVELTSSTELPLSETPTVNLNMAILVNEKGRTYNLSTLLEDAFREGDSMYNRIVFKEQRT